MSCLLIGYDASRRDEKMNMFIFCRSRIKAESKSNPNCNSRFSASSRLGDEAPKKNLWGGAVPPTQKIVYFVTSKWHILVNSEVLNIKYVIGDLLINLSPNQNIGDVSPASTVGLTPGSSAGHDFQQKRQSYSLMPNTHRRLRRDETVLSRRRRRCEHEFATIVDSFVVSSVWTHPSAVVTQFTIFCADKWRHNDVIV